MRRGDIIKIVAGSDQDKLGKVIDIDMGMKTARIAILVKNSATGLYEESTALKDFEAD